MSEAGASADQPPATVGTADHYGSFIKLCRLRIEQLGISYETCDEICGFPTRYTGKLLSGERNCGGYSLFTLCRALALLPSFLHDQAELEQRHSAWTRITDPGVLTRRRGPQWQSSFGSRSLDFGPDWRRARARAGGLARARKLGRKKASELGRRLVRLRKWRPVGGGKQTA
jgi:hypothetical protein